MSPFLLRRASDENLGGRLAAGEAAAFDELYRRYARRLAAYGANLTGDRSAGDDVAQTALMKAYAAIVDGRAPAHVRPWLFRIAHNAALDLIARRREVPTLSVGDRAAAPQHDPLAGVLVTAVAALPERQRHVFVLRELHGLRIDETAAELGLSAPQVEQALFAARNRLSEQLTFGGRLDCVSVRRLGLESLDVRERRALKAHLRSCSACRAEGGAAGARERRRPTRAAALAAWSRRRPRRLVGGSPQGRRGRRDGRSGSRRACASDRDPGGSGHTGRGGGHPARPGLPGRRAGRAATRCGASCRDRRRSPW